MTDITELQMTAQRLAERVAALEAMNLTTAHALYRVLRDGHCVGMDDDLAALHAALLGEAKATPCTVTQAYDCVHCGPVRTGCLAANCPISKADDRPAWRRAKVGDRVECKGPWIVGAGTVVSVDDVSDTAMRLRVRDGRRCDYYIYNTDIVRILPPDPDRPKDETAADGHASDCATHNEPAYPNGPCDCGVAPSPASLDALKAEATEDISRAWKAVIGFRKNNTAGTAAEVDAAIRSLIDDAHALGLSERVQPIDMVLFCPACGAQHIDEPHDDWTNPPHRSHQCQECDYIWRPADVATNGVRRIKTRGRADAMALPVRFPEKPQGEAGQDVRERAMAVVWHAAADHGGTDAVPCFSIVDALASAGPLASAQQPQTVTRRQIALGRDDAVNHPEGQTGRIEEILCAIFPGIVIEGA